MSTCKYCGTDPGWEEHNCRGAEERSHCYRLGELGREFWRVTAESGGECLDSLPSPALPDPFRRS